MKKVSYILPVTITKQGRRFVAYTPALDISTSGTSLKTVQKRFEEIVNIFLEEVAEAGTLKDVLSEMGWKKIERKWQPPQVVSSPYLGIKIPSLA